MNENPTASKTFLRPSAPISLELTSFATCKDGQIDEIQAVMGFWSPRHRLLFTIYIIITSISAAIFSLSVLAFSISLMQRSKSIVTAPWCALYRKQRCSFADSAIYIEVLGQQLNVIHWSECKWNRKPANYGSGVGVRRSSLHRQLGEEIRSLCICMAGRGRAQTQWVRHQHDQWWMIWWKIYQHDDTEFVKH